MFHPSARLIWGPPVIPDAGSGWRLWTWGSRRGPGEAAFPRFWSAEELGRGGPGGTTCVRLPLGAAPDFDGAGNPCWKPGRLAMRGIRLDRGIGLGEGVAIHSPYASQPAVNGWLGIAGGGVKGPRLIQGPDLSRVSMFIDDFHIPWWVRVRAEIKRVKDLAEERERCERVPDADGGGKPDGGIAGR
ncbi:hypothetical protein [Thermoflexus sp.]|uniref:hypothetical protein n=1 Tax=Thermoflexus sp. TaxID=1969742 RepID=UPI0035E40742